MKILVVDDEELLVKGIRFNLQNEGYDVITGCNGAEAVILCKNEAPDLVILDVMMPEMDGMTACRKIREFSNVPVILLTAKADDIDKLMGRFERMEQQNKSQEIKLDAFDDEKFEHCCPRCGFRY